MSGVTGKQDSAGILNVSHMNCIPHGHTYGEPTRLERRRAKGLEYTGGAA